MIWNWDYGTLTFPVVTHEINICTVLSNHCESTIQSDWRVFDEHMWLSFKSPLDVSLELFVLKDKQAFPILFSLTDILFSLTNLERFPRALTAFDFI